MTAAILALCLVQDDRDPDATKLPGEADRFYRLAQWGDAEKLMREAVAKDPTDRNRSGLVTLLYRARKYDECAKECDPLELSGDLSARAYAAAMRGACACKKGNAEAAKGACDEALKHADVKGPNALPGVRSMVRETRAFLSWSRHESKRFLIFYPPDSPLALDMVEHAARLEAAYERTAAALEAGVPDKIEAYYFNDQRQADEIIGSPLNFAVPRARAFYALYTASAGHETAHVISFFAAGARGKERPKSALLNEGLATAFAQDALWERRIADVPATLLRQEKLRALTDWTSGTGVDFTATAGSFVRWLYEKHGKEKFLRLWVEYNDHADPWSAVYGAKLEELDAAWRATLKK